MFSWISYFRSLGSLASSRHRDTSGPHCVADDVSGGSAALPTDTSANQDALSNPAEVHHDSANHAVPQISAQPRATGSPSVNSPCTAAASAKDEAEKRRNIGRVLVNLDPSLEEEIFGTQNSDAMTDYRNGRVSGLLSIHAASPSATGKAERAERPPDATRTRLGVNAVNRLNTQNDMCADDTSAAAATNQPKAASSRVDTTNTTTRAGVTPSSTSSSSTTIKDTTPAVGLPVIPVTSLTDAEAAAELTATVRADRDRVLSYEARIHEVLTSIEDTRRRYFVLSADALPCERAVGKLTQCYEQLNRDIRAHQTASATRTRAVEGAAAGSSAVNVSLLRDTERNGASSSENDIHDGRLKGAQQDVDVERKSTLSSGMARIASSSLSSNSCTTSSQDAHAPSHSVDKERVRTHDPVSGASVGSDTDRSGDNTSEAKWMPTMSSMEGQALHAFVVRDFSRCDDLVRELRACVEKTLHHYDT